MAECPDSGTTLTTGSLNLMSNLPINIDDLLGCQSVEKQRLEFKKSWNKGPTKIQVTNTISAFANDFYNDNGGYVIIGVEEDDSVDAVGQVKFPLVGIPVRSLEKTCKEIMGACKSNIKPPYTPIISPEIVDGRHVLVIWAQASDDRPHMSKVSEKGENRYFVRKGNQTVKANDEEVKILLENARKVPFDDRLARQESGLPVDLSVINEKILTKYLCDIRSKLEGSLESRVEKLKLVGKYGDKKIGSRLKPVFVPRNVGILLFNEFPDQYFHGAFIEVAELSRDKEVLKEYVLKGPLDKQVKDCIELVLRSTNKERSVGSLTYPKRALREAIVNAVYHRGYEAEYNNPIKISIRPHCLEIISYPGPHPSLKPDDFVKGNDIPQVPARNRRIGEFLKDLKLAEARGTGVNTIFKSMEENTNPQPEFKFDSWYFQVTLPAHPKFQASMLLQDVEQLEATGNKYQAGKVLQTAFDKDPSIISQALLQKLISLHDGSTDHPNVQKYKDYISCTTKKRCALLEQLQQWLEQPKRLISVGVYLIMELVKVGADANDLANVTAFVDHLQKERHVDTRKPLLDSNQYAHQLLVAYGKEIISQNTTIAYYFACVKYNIYIATKEKRRRCATGRKAPMGILRYLIEAREYLENAVVICEMQEKPTFVALQYKQLGYILFNLCLEGKATTSEYKHCYAKAMEFDPKIRINSTLNPANVP